MLSSHARHIVIAGVLFLFLVAAGFVIYVMNSSMGEENESTQKVAGTESEENTMPEVGSDEGMLAPPFTLDTIDGRRISLEDYRGEKAVILWFMVPVGCPICKSQAPEIVKVYEEYMDSVEVVVVTILDYEGVEEDIRSFAESYGHPNWLYAIDPGDLALQYNIYEMGVILIDTNGIIKLRAIPSADYNELKTALDSILSGRQTMS